MHWQNIAQLEQHSIIDRDDSFMTLFDIIIDLPNYAWSTLIIYFLFSGRNICIFPYYSITEIALLSRLEIEITKKNRSVDSFHLVIFDGTNFELIILTNFWRQLEQKEKKLRRTLFQW